MNKKLLILLFLFLPPYTANPIGGPYHINLKELKNHYRHFKSQVKEDYKIDTVLMFSVVYPEICRYNALQNKAEVYGLNLLYTELGNKYANYSIGPFQMKPSFAELIESEAAHSKKVPRYIKTRLMYQGSRSEKEIRRTRIARLNDITYQIIYLSSFYHIVKTRYENELSHAGRRQVVHLFANAYNLSHTYNPQKLILHSDKKIFVADNILIDYKSAVWLCYEYLLGNLYI